MKSKRLHSNRKQMKKNNINFNLKNIFFINLVSGLVTSVITFRVITFVKIVSALHVLMGHLLLLFFFLRKTMVLTYHS